jgi:hypothetical protein
VPEKKQLEASMGGYNVNIIVFLMIYDFSACYREPDRSGNFETH